MNYTYTKYLKLQLLILAILGLGTYTYSQADFMDVSEQSGFNNLGANKGVAIGDYDNDGDDDVYISLTSGSNVLYQNNGDGTYTNQAASLGVNYSGNTHASIWGDFDNDGHIDLYLGNKNASNKLYHNNGDGSFTDITEAAGVGVVSDPRSMLVADVDRDGYLDIYVLNLFAENALLRNNGDLTFTDITMESGATDPQLSMGAMFFDYDNDGDPDLYLTHDGNQPNILYQNDGTGKFVDVSATSGTNYAGFGMGVDFGDINNDGWLDIYFTNLYDNTLLLSNGDPNGTGEVTFTDISDQAMVTDQGMGWGTTFLDYNNDGLQDIYMVNDSYFSPLPNILYRNKGDNTFEIVSANSPLASMYAAYGTACTDINKDGLVDIFVANSGDDDGNQLFQNMTSNAGNWFQLKTVGTISNRLAIGTKVTIEAGGKIFTDEVSGGSGYASQNSQTLHFGLGAIETIDKMTIRWPNGLVETYENLAVNELMIAVENESINVNTANPEDFGLVVRTFPNPVTTMLNVYMETQESMPLNVYVSDINGRKIAQLFSRDMQMEAQLLQWAPPSNTGVYLLTIQSEKFASTRKIIVGN